MQASPDSQATAAAPPLADVRISRLHLAAFTLPVLLFQAIEMAWRAYLPRFLNLDVGIALGLVGALMLGARLLDAVADPLLGWLSDMRPTRFGRRKPWMAAGAILVPLGALPLFLAPAGSAFGNIVIASLLLHIGYSFIITPHGGWGLELSRDRHQRTRIMGAKVWFGVLGSLAMLGILAILERGFGISLRTEMALVGWTIALLAPLTVLCVILLFQERATPVAHAPRHPARLFVAMLRDPAMRALLMLYMVTGIGDAAAASSFLYLVEDALSLERWGASLLLIQPVVALVALPVWSRLSARIGRRNVLMISYGWQAVCVAMLLALPPGAPLMLAGILVLKGLGWGVDFMLLRAMVADLSDKDADGATVAGSYYGVSSIALKIAMGLGSGGVMWGLALVSGEAWDDLRFVAIRLLHCAPIMIGAVVAIRILRGRGQIERAGPDVAIVPG